jgi:hypothetical protein
MRHRVQAGYGEQIAWAVALGKANRLLTGIAGSANPKAPGMTWDHVRSRSADIMA